ncbi:outer membrane porin, OprD family [Sulfuricurvum sp. IAE1]|uniref:OprD family outer membrane porin n=1 Tax=Sulfuricurvum sp. IAE1 TaxID=2546102 RepID=UPI00104917B4|nr:OprD family outer membrane porin [Sulfuricurvum sp. IAE1]TDA62770.1 outer membrane porin, OprD family [Sulfuricurvum sp. IAE1]
MKLVKMSLAAAVMLGASAFAIDNVKVSGDAKLFYGTDNKTQAAGVGDDLFDQANSYADTALRLSVTADLTKNVSMGATAYAISTLGLENNLVANTWTNGHDAEVEDNSWMGELWLAGTMGKTTLKVGRMELDTPMAFSEKWSIVPNTFDAAVVINQDIPDTTLVGAWVGKSNGTDAITGAGATVADRDGLLRDEAKFSKFMEKGAYAAAIVNNSFKPLVAQAWYYNIGMVADAYWLQADIDCQLVKGVKIGAQYADVDVKSNGKLGASAEDSSAYAFKLAYQGIEGLNVSAAYSKADDKGTVRIQNVAAGANATGQSKLYTEAWWNYGYVGSKDAEALNLTAEYDMKDIAKFGVYYTTVSNDIAASTHEMDEVAVTASKSFGALDTTLAYISTNADDANNGKQYDTVQAYLTLKF